MLEQTKLSKMDFKFSYEVLGPKHITDYLCVMNWDVGNGCANKMWISVAWDNFLKSYQVNIGVHFQFCYKLIFSVELFV